MNKKIFSSIKMIVLCGVLVIGSDSSILPDMGSSSIAFEERGEAVKTIRLIFPPSPTPRVEYIGRIFTQQVQDRCEVQVVTHGKAPFTVELYIKPGFGAEGFRIDGGKKGIVRIIGNDERGLLYGVGKFLHTSIYNTNGFTPGSWRGISIPAMPVRGIYFATHFQNYYQVAPINEVIRYIEDLSLWGTNSFLLAFGMEEFNGIDDPKAQAMLTRLNALLKTVKELGLNASLGCVPNMGYKNSPLSLRADDRTVDHEGYHTKMGNRIYNLGPELCPSKPGVPEMLMSYCREQFDAFKNTGLDFWSFWPYDNGGCTCPDCSPWGANGYLRTVEPLARDFRRAFPNGKIILSTWYFDRWAYGEWAGISTKFKANKPDWVDYVLADNFEDYPRYPLENGVPGGFPLINFPEISMWGQDPWGGYGANPYPARLQERWNETKMKLSGGFPYSEGIYEDLNKVICTQLYWTPNLPALETIKEYIAFEFSPEIVEDIVSVINIFETNNIHNPKENNIDESAVRAYKMIEEADSRLTPFAHSSWRWRLFYIRAKIDNELYRNKSFQGRDEVFRQAYDELMSISLAQNAWPMLRPTLIRAIKVTP